MTTLYPARRTGGVVWYGFGDGAPRYFWHPGLDWAPDSTGPLWDTNARDINADVTLAQAERSLRQLGHTIGEWDKEHG